MLRLEVFINQKQIAHIGIHNTGNTEYIERDSDKQAHMYDVYNIPPPYKELGADKVGTISHYRPDGWEVLAVKALECLRSLDKPNVQHNTNL